MDTDEHRLAVDFYPRRSVFICGFLRRFVLRREPTDLSVHVSVHVSVHGQVHQQINELPEGTPISEIKIR